MRERNHKNAQFVITAVIKSSLKIHINAGHEGEQPHKYSICSRYFALKDQLKVFTKKKYALQQKIICKSILMQFV